MALRTNVGKLKDILLKAGVIDEYQMRSAMGHLEQWGGRLTGVIVEMGFCDDETMMKAVSSALKLPIMHLGMVQKEPKLLAKVDVAFCDEHCLFPVSIENRAAVVAVSDPTELDTLDAVASKLGMRIQVVVSSESEIRAAIAKHYRGYESHGIPNRNLQRDAHIAATTGTVFEYSSGSQVQHVPVAREPERPREPEPVMATQAPPVAAWQKKPPSANTLLDEFLNAPADGGNWGGFTDDELKRLDIARDNQVKTAAVLRTLQALLKEKGYLK